MKADSMWKELLEQLFVEFVQFFFPEIHRDIDFSKGYQFLDKEFQRITKDAKTGRKIVDKLVKVFLKDGSEKWLLIHIEIQGQREKDFAKRMFIYNYRIFDKYQKEVISLALLTDRDVNYRPNVFEVKRWGFVCSFKFPLVKIIDYIDYEFEKAYKKNPFSMAVQAFLKTMETEGDDQFRYRWKKRFVLTLYDLGLKRETLYALYRFIECLMELPEGLDEQLYQEVKEKEEDEEMSLITIAEKKGRQKGLQEGIQKGIQKGLQEGIQKGIQKGLQEGIQKGMQQGKLA
ncbi:MAG: cytosolic protein, partial [Calditrichaeota bacterium]|nr:cytosolic protein [Calditrichota bacterium]